MRRAGGLLLVLVLAAAIAGCGERKETLGDATAIYGPGVAAKPPPWMPEYAHLAARIKQLGLPPIGKEQVHHHALVHIYNEGLLIPIAPQIGLHGAVASSVHTHDSTGIVHMESIRPHDFTLGDFFAIWGVRFGDASLGSFANKGDRQVRVYVNGRRVAKAARYVMRDGDNISIGYGSDSSFPHDPSRAAFKLVSGKGGGTCAKSSPGKKATSCVRPTGGR